MSSGKPFVSHMKVWIKSLLSLLHLDSQKCKVFKSSIATVFRLWWYQFFIPLMPKVNLTEHLSACATVPRFLICICPFVLYSTRWREIAHVHTGGLQQSVSVSVCVFVCVSVCAHVCELVRTVSNASAWVKRVRYFYSTFTYSHIACIHLGPQTHKQHWDYMQLCTHKHGHTLLVNGDAPWIHKYTNIWHRRPHAQ